MPASQWRGQPIQKTAVVSDYMTVTGATRVCAPNLDGRDWPESLAGGSGYYGSFYYPSTSHWGQWLFFYTPGDVGVLVRSQDPTASTANWSYSKDTKTVYVQFFGEYTDLYVDVIAPDPAEAMRVYRNWASQQFWWPTDFGRLNDINSCGLDASYGSGTSSPENYMAATAASGRRAMWMTGWREGGFDVNYPNYTSRSYVRDFVTLCEDTNDVICFPYFNAILAHQDNVVPGYNPDWACVQKWGGARYYNLQYIDINTGLTTSPSYLQKAMQCCATVKEFQDLLLDQFCAIRKVGGAKIGGIYLDVATGVTPGSNHYFGIDPQPGGGGCWAFNHPHEPGDPTCHMRGVRELIQRFRDLGVRVIGEHSSEVYMDVLDGSLAFGSAWDTGTNAPSAYAQPFFNMVYGHARRECYWDFNGMSVVPSNIGPVSDAAMLSEIQRAESFGRIWHGTPTNIVQWQNQLVDGGHPLSLARINSPDGP